jgi:hypothetical protein
VTDQSETFNVVVEKPKPHAYLVIVDHATARWTSIPMIRNEDFPLRYRNGLRGVYYLRPDGSFVTARR